MATIKLEGIIYKAFENYVVFRGFAPIGEIAEISEKPDSYQREPDKQHLKDIVNFLDRGEYKYFPELILACRADHYSEFLNSVGSNDGIPPNSARYVEGLFIKDDYIPIKGKRARHANIDITNKILKRVDGNHRLTPFDYVGFEMMAFWGDVDKNRVSEIIVPFCIIFTNSEIAEKFETSIFNNINFKQLPLKQEKNLQNIHKYLQDSNELGEYHNLTMNLIDLCNKGHFKGIPHLSPSGEDEVDIYRTACQKITKLIVDKHSEFKKTKEGQYSDAPDIANIEIAIQSLRSIYTKFGVNRGNLSLLAVLVYYKLTSETKFTSFVRWVDKNGINRIEVNDILPSHNATSLIELFERIFEAKRKEIFISMQFGDNQSELIYEKIVRTVERYNKEYSLDLQIRPLRIDEYVKGETYTITDEILDAINNCSLMIADLSSGNKNVYHEIGYAMALSKINNAAPSILLLLKENSDKITSDIDIDKFVGFNIRGFSQIRFTTYEQLISRLFENLKTHFSI